MSLFFVCNDCWRILVLPLTACGFVAIDVLIFQSRACLECLNERVVTISKPELVY